ncbi:MAG: 30S ribosomal protein S8 [Candidatus Nealsonbacteria bacterium]|nr:30S ribosomal protein S8 [Candidatus Nealsonbacteria bacterium]
MDPITDMLNRIRNAQAVLKPTVAISFSRLNYGIAEILKKEGFVAKIERKKRKTKQMIEITLKYPPVISGLKRVSRPGQRIYSGVKELKPVKGGVGMAIISTSKGLMTDKEAKKKKLGGEVICEIW